MADPKATTLQRGLRSRHVSMIALGGIVGSAYFLGTGYVFNELGPCIFLAYIFGGLITFLTMSSLAELTSADPAYGSFIHYVIRYISPAVGCGIGWSYWISWLVFLPSECLAAGIIIHNFTPDIPIYLWTIFFGLLITFINFSNVKLFGELEFVLSLIKIIIGLAAAESKNPQKSTVSALKKIVVRLFAIYIIPTFLLALIFPWQESTLSGSVFSSALNKYGFLGFAHLFNFLIIAGAISCANSGLYATTRSLYALALSGMAPSPFKAVNSNGTPVKATLITVAMMWVLILCTLVFPAHKLYANLLAISGFTCTFCWMAICWAQYRFRKLNPDKKLSFKAPFFPLFPLLAIFLQALCLIVVAWSPSLRSAFYLGIPALVIPFLAYKCFVEKNKK
jgi:amino acid transporter, AAT family